MLASTEGTARAPDGHGITLPPSSHPPPSEPLHQGSAAGPLAPGTAFGVRYHIIRLLGAGGMGAVYQAWDDELGQAVAIKVIRPEVTGDPPAARDIERRFKRELVLARQVTHRNVVRIHDLGEIGGIKYITMPYIQGSDLSSVLAREGRLGVRRALAIARDVAAGLQAAHEAGVVHRDLKPANIMIDADDRPVIMDFGIARSMSGPGATVAGAVIGTLEYMAPEQALAHPVDHRADIYAFGLIIYDMLLGRRDQSRAESAVAELMHRMRDSLPPIRTRDPGLPAALEEVICRCIAPDPAARYQTTAELGGALALLDADGHPLVAGSASRPVSVFAEAASHASVPAAVSGTQSTARSWKLPIAAAAMVAALVIGAFGIYLFVKPPASGQETTASSERPVALAILPFRNASGAASLDWLGTSLADMMRSDIGQSAQLRLVSSERLFQILRDLRIGPDTSIDGTTVKQVADFSSADTVVSGRFVRLGDQIRMEATLHAPGRDNVVLTASAVNEADVLRAANELAAAIRASLSLPAAAVRELQARVFKPSSESVDALRYYSEGLRYTRQGELLEAVRRFEASTAADPRFALAFAKLGQALSGLGRAAEAEEYSRKAVDLSPSLPVEERDLILGTHARIVNDLDTAIASYERLVQALPSDTDRRVELAGLYESTGSLDRARDEYARVLQMDEKHPDALYAAGRVAIQQQNFEGALDYLGRALNLAIQLDNREAKARVQQALGIAYKRLGKLDEALAQYQESLAIKRQIGDRRGAAASLSEIATVHDFQGRPEEAAASYKEALGILRTIADKRGVGRTLINLGASYLDRGRYDEALGAFKEALPIAREVGDEGWQARCLSNMGNVYFAKGQYEDARTYLERALELREKSKVAGEIASTLSSLGDVSIRLGEYERAQQRYLRAMDLSRTSGDKRGVAIASYGLGALFEYQGRYGAAIDARAEAVTTFRDLRERSYWLAETLSGYGGTLAMAGRYEDARKALEESLTLSRELANQTLVAQILGFQGDTAYFEGDPKSARALYTQAAQAASTTGDRYQVLRARVNLARLAAEETPAAAVAELTTLTQEAEDVGLRYVSAECGVYLGTALVSERRFAEARRVLESALTKSERLGSRALLARSHYLLATALRGSGSGAAAASHYREVQQILDALRKDARSDALLARRDLAPAHEDTARWLRDDQR